MSKKLITEDKITVSGYVKNFKIKETKESKVKKAEITISDKMEGSDQNRVMVTMFNRNNLKFGFKKEAEDITLAGLEKRFLDKDKKPLNKIVTCIGSTSDFITEDGKTYDNNLIFAIGNGDQSNIRATFLIQGICERVKEINSGEGYSVRLGMLRKDKDENILGIQYKTVVVKELEDIETVEGVSKGDLIKVKGYIISKLPGYDEFGDLNGEQVREFACAKLVVIAEKDDLREEDVENYKKAKKLAKGEKILSSKSKKDKDDEDGFGDED